MLETTLTRRALLCGAACTALAGLAPTPPARAALAAGLPSAPPARARAQPAALRTAAVASRKDRIGALWFYGLVENTGREPLRDVQVTLGLLDGAGNTLVEASAPALVQVLPSGARAPFALLVAEPPADWRREGWALSAQPVQPDDAAASVTAGLAISETRVAEGAWGKQIIGQVKNDTAAPVSDIQLAVALYRRDGRVEYVTVGFLASETLAPGEQFPFAVDLPGLAADFRIDRYDIFPEGWRR